MRRNTTTILKYVAAACVLIIFGPGIIRTLTHSSSESSGLPAFDRGALPVDHDNSIAKRDDSPQRTVAHDKENRAPPIRADEKIDWHDWTKINEEQQRQGPGEQGQAVVLTAEDEKEKDKLYKVNGFNGLASDKMSLYRSMKDIRHPQCKTQNYLAKLPTVSVVVPFHNEHWSTLLRTAVSVLNRAPPELVHEVILADDASTKDFLGAKLEEHLANNYDGKVKVVRAKKREGLIRTRLLGAKAATGDVLLFLDSHCEANVNFLPPLLEPIAMDRKTVVCPFIDVLDYETFAYRAQDEGARGAFDWEFFYKRLPITEEDKKHPSQPFDSPVMAGGLFAMDRKWFWELGGYDPGLDIWGGEQYELSFKIWQCHGRMVDAPCSRIGHVYRKFAPFPNPGVGDFVGRNYRRVAEVWMDEYANYLYDHRPHYRDIDPGDLTEQKAIREKHNCKPFKFFMEEVAFDLVKYYPPVEPEPYANGPIKNKNTDMCLDTKHSNNPGVTKCGSGGEQQFQLSWHMDLRVKGRTMCLDVSTSIDKAPIVLFNCHGMKGNQFWKYNLETSQLYHQVSNQCMDANTETKEVYMTHCEDDKQSQKWEFNKMNITAVQQLWNYRLS